ncbi:c-type cytochrome [Campylobacter sp. US33a]|uniref:C-type cytochrome n=1 Tax=Campylobacter sp. CCS1377 TaxID=3158229 RepID=A0AAU7E5R5_9BACT|nr:c-type cytochrome [Campylobacter sp. US33a]MCW1360619.1 c-type cytochrome [Campylobacter jejuni]TEY03579.1 c-type cytochrome [Campylobacter sp. US33a]
MFRILFILIICFTFGFGISLKSLFSYTFDGASYDMAKAKELYFEKKCHICHGDNGEKIVAGSRILRNMEPADIKSALIDYTTNASGEQSATRIQMLPYANSLSHDEMNYIIAYLKGGNFAIEMQAKDLLEEEPEKKTKHGTFIK